jgi:hypothetical protein
MRVSGFPSCCGLNTVSELYDFDVRGLPANMATVAVTSPDQENTGIGQRLRDAGYERVGQFRGIHGYNLNLYLRQPLPRPPAPVYANGGGLFISRRTGRRVTDGWARRNPTKVTRF